MWGEYANPSFHRIVLNTDGDAYTLTGMLDYTIHDISLYNVVGRLSLADLIKMRLNNEVSENSYKLLIEALKND